jgi:Zn-dependent M28 family amino/carboxypeptidase
MKTEIWNTAEKLGYNTAFIQEEKYSMLDDHTPFLEAGIPAVDVIDFDYEFWHTTQDTMDKVSIESLKMIVDVMSSWIEGQ